MELSKYLFVFEYIPCSSNVLADYLSRSTFEKNNIEPLNSNPELIFDEYQALPIGYIG